MTAARSLKLSVAALALAATLGPAAGSPAVADETVEQRTVPAHLVLDTTSPTSTAAAQRELEALRTTLPGAEVDPAELAPSLPAVEAPVGSGLRLCFAADVPPDVQQAAIDAAALWDDVLVLDGPTVEIDVYWVEFARASSLGAAGPVGFVSDERLPRPGVRYPTALANQLLGSDTAPRARCDLSSDGEIIVLLNSRAGGDGSLWHTGPGVAPASKVDLRSVLLHELGHGFGFVGSAEQSAQGQLAWPSDGGEPFVFDFGSRRCGLDDPASCARDQGHRVSIGDVGALTSAELWFDTGLGPFVEISAPSVWNVGSSFSHVDEQRYGASGSLSLMTPILDEGEVHREVDNLTLGVLQALGWRSTRPLDRPPPVTVLPGDGQVVLSVLQDDPVGGLGPAEIEITIDRVVRTSDGTDFVRAFAPVTTGNRVVAVTGLTNGVDYRVGVRGLNGRNGSAVTHSDTIRPLELAPFAAAEDFATQLLRDVNRSEPSTAAVQIIADSGRSRGVVSVTSETLGGNVGLRHRIMARLYLGFLDRIPDYGGLVFWMNDIAAQPSLTRVATRFARAAEFELGSALGNRDFVAEVYRTILDREPEPGGLGYWTERLDDGTPRGRALLEISESIEHRNSTEPGSMVIVTFATLLERLPTEEELANWRRRVANGEFVAMVTEIVGSPEYAERVSP